MDGRGEAEIDSYYVNGMESFKSMELVHTARCGPLDISVKSNPRLGKYQLDSVPDLSRDSGFWPGFMQVTKPRDGEGSLDNLQSSDPAQLGDVVVFRLVEGRRHQVDTPQRVLGPPEAYRDFWTVSPFDAYPWKNFISASNGAGKYIIYFSKPQRFRWNGGVCEFQWPDLEVVITD